MTQAQADIPPHRYTAELANEIEARWQDYWEENGTFQAPNPVGPMADPEHPRAHAGLPDPGLVRVLSARR